MLTAQGLHNEHKCNVNDCLAPLAITYALNVTFGKLLMEFTSFLLPESTKSLHKTNPAVQPHPVKERSWGAGSISQWIHLSRQSCCCHLNWEIAICFC